MPRGGKDVMYKWDSPGAMPCDNAMPTFVYSRCHRLNTSFTLLYVTPLPIHPSQTQPKQGPKSISLPRSDVPPHLHQRCHPHKRAYLQEIFMPECFAQFWATLLLRLSEQSFWTPHPILSNFRCCTVKHFCMCMSPELQVQVQLRFRYQIKLASWFSLNQRGIDIYISVSRVPDILFELLVGAILLQHVATSFLGSLQLDPDKNIKLKLILLRSALFHAKTWTWTFGDISFLQVFIGDILEEKGRATVEEFRKEFGAEAAYYHKVDVTVKCEVEGRPSLWNDYMHFLHMPEGHLSRKADCALAAAQTKLCRVVNMYGCPNLVLRELWSEPCRETSSDNSAVTTWWLRESTTEYIYERALWAIADCSAMGSVTAWQRMQAVCFQHRSKVVSWFGFWSGWTFAPVGKAKRLQQENRARFRTHVASHLGLSFCRVFKHFQS